MYCSKATENGHLIFLQWTREYGCDWNVMTCTSAAANGHLKPLRWARESGCIWSSDVFLSVANAGGHTEVVLWIDLVLLNEL